jgi:hypothetical protein
MANAHNYRNGEQVFVRPAVDSAIVIERGDICFLNTDDVRPASSYAYDTSESVTQAAFTAVFLGIADDASPAGDTTPINVDIGATSVYEFTCSSTTWEIGTTFAVDVNGTSALFSQVLDKQSAASRCIARARNRATAASTKVQVSFASAYNTGSANSNAAL